MKLRRISLRGFRAFADEASFEFGEGLTYVHGPNESGKSSLMLALINAIFPATPAKALNLHAQGCEECVVSLDYESEGRSWSLQRDLHSNRHLLREMDGDTELGRYDKQDRVREIVAAQVGTDETLFRSSLAAIHQQVRVLPDEDRLAKSLDERIEELVSGGQGRSAARAIKALNEQAAELKRRSDNAKIPRLQTELASVTARHRDLQAGLDEQARHQETIERAESDLARLREELSVLNAAAQAQRDLTALRNRAAGQEREKAVLDQILDRAANLGLVASAAAGESVGAAELTRGLDDLAARRGRLESLRAEAQRHGLPPDLEELRERITLAHRPGPGLVRAQQAMKLGMVLIGIGMLASFFSLLLHAGAWLTLPAVAVLAGVLVFGAGYLRARGTGLPDRDRFERLAAEVGTTFPAGLLLVLKEVAQARSRLSELEAEDLAQRRELTPLAGALLAQRTALGRDLEDVRERLQAGVAETPEATVRREQRLRVLPGLISELETNIARASARLDGLEEKVREVIELEARQRELEQALKWAELRFTACQLAATELQLAVDQLKASFHPDLQARASEILRQVAPQRFAGMVLDPVTIAPSPVLLATGEPVAISQLSDGTQDQVGFALRVALGEILIPGSTLPLILDDPFRFSDSERLGRLLDILPNLARTRQVLYFSVEPPPSDLDGTRIELRSCGAGAVQAPEPPSPSPTAASR